MKTLIAGQSTNTSLYTTYQWTPDPHVSTIIAAVIIAVTLLPAICSLCYHFSVRRKDVILVSIVSVRFLHNW